MGTQVLISESYTEKYERRSHSVGISMWHLNIQPDHVHCVVGIKLSMSPNYAMQILKGISAKLFFRMNPKARQDMHHA